MLGNFYEEKIKKNSIILNFRVFIIDVVIKIYEYVEEWKKGYDIWYWYL